MEKENKENNNDEDIDVDDEQFKEFEEENWKRDNFTFNENEYFTDKFESDPNNIEKIKEIYLSMKKK